MDVGSKFSLVDFLAYFFPGIASTLGLFVLLLLTPLKPLLMSIKIDISRGILFLSLSYVVGVLLSGFAEIIARGRDKLVSKTWSKATIPVPGFEAQVRSAFHAVFRDGAELENEWSPDHYYLCRSLVMESMPNLAPFIDRQSGLRQLRMNLMPAVTIWSIAGIAWGIWAILNKLPVWGYLLAIGSGVLWGPIMWSIINRMHRNEDREVREVLTAFVSGYKTGRFKGMEGSKSS